MCVIVYKPKGTDINMENLQSCWEHNRDGAGLMFAEDGMLKVAKGFMKWRSFKRYIKRGLKKNAERWDDTAMVFHFRIATHGTVKPRNCHPFQVNNGLAMAHNGVMSNVDIPDDEDISDSEAFLQRYVRDAFSSISISALSSGMPINELFSKFIGGSKLVFMDNDGDVAIVNEKAGTWVNGTWYSNMLWKSYTKTTSTKLTRAWNSYGGAGYGVNHGPKITATQFEEDDTEDSNDWYCFDCYSYFALGESPRIFWANITSDKIVDCPGCSSANTAEVGEEMFSDRHEDEDDFIFGTQWKCYDCSNTFDEDSAVMLDNNGEYRCVCPFCECVLTYELEWEDMVTRFGASFFEASVYDVTRGGADA